MSRQHTLLRPVARLTECEIGTVMGSIQFGDELATFSDEVVGHLRAVIQEKLRAGESFALTWARPAAAGSGRTAVWVQPAAPPVFNFTGPPPPLNRGWALSLLQAANSPAGLVVDSAGHPAAEEPAQPTPSGPPPGDGRPATRA